MFKIESYVTPILLSYVDKYVRDFKPADAQVSLWGGGVALHNLVLKADVLQQEVALPFTLVSGRIHELLIQVPWTKIMSEPIIVTIDTIECVLSLNPPVGADDSPRSPSPSSRKTTVMEAPPGYMQALVRRIVSNISLRIHHLIVKYVQDDIVMSLNVKHLAIDSAGANWEPAFADIEQSEPLVRRLVRLDDLTLCLDKSDGDGKIRFFQEPLLYRCQLDFRVLTRLISANTRRATSLDIQLRSGKLAWSVTNEQLSLLLRLIKERPVAAMPPPMPKQNVSQPPLSSPSANAAEPIRSESWSEWAWSWLPTWVDRERDTEEAPPPATALPVSFIAYFDDVSLMFKVMEIDSRRRSRDVLELCATHAALKSSICSPTYIRVRFGAREVTVRSQGKCVCGYVNYLASNLKPTLYLQKATKSAPVQEWTWPEEVQTDKVEEAKEAVDVTMVAPTVPVNSLLSAVTQASKITQGSKIVQEGDPANVTTETSSVESTIQMPDLPDRDEVDELWTKMEPLVYIQYIHERSPPNILTNPYENPPNNFEYSDWVEECSMSIVVAPVNLRLCMGLIHRVVALHNIYKEHALQVPDPTRRVLTVEENESLSENLPQISIKFEVRDVRVHMIPWDHSSAERPSLPTLVLLVELPNTTAAIVAPMYPHRVCSAASQIPTDAGSLWQGARRHLTLIANAVQVHLANYDGNEIRPCGRADIRLVTHQLLHKEFFTKRQSVEFAYNLKITDMNVCGSAARLQAAIEVPMSLIKQEPSYVLKYTTLPNDAVHDENAVAIDINLEEYSMRGYITNNIKTHVILLQSAKITALQESRDSETSQAWLLSAPDVPTPAPYLRLAFQWCNEVMADSLDYCGLWTEPLTMSVDPLLISWLGYKPLLKSEGSVITLKNNTSSQQMLRRHVTPPSSSGRGGSRAAGGAELVHVRSRSHGSSSEPSEKKAPKTPPKTQPPQQQFLWLSNDEITKLHSRLRNMLLNVELGLALVYVTMSTVSAVNCATLRDAMERHANDAHRVLVFCLGRLSMQSSSVTRKLWLDIQHDGPTFLKEKTKDEAFPWKIRLSDVSCSTLEARAAYQSQTTYKPTLKTSEAATVRTMLDLVTTTITLSVVTKTMKFMEIPKEVVRRQAAGLSAEEKKTRYFSGGLDFKPTSLREFVRGPSNRMRTERKQKSENQLSDEAAHRKNAIGPDQVIVKEGPLCSLGINLHADTPPIILRLEQDQVKIVAAGIHCLTHILTVLRRPPITAPPSTFTPSGTKLGANVRSASELEEIHSASEDTSDNQVELVAIFDRMAQYHRPLKTFFWFQWVVSRVTLVVASETVKLALDIDDVIGTVDFQAEYNQLKLKLASASIKHYERSESDEWTTGVMCGRVLEAREPVDAKEDGHFLTVTVTQAQVSHLPPQWKEDLNTKLHERNVGADCMWEVYATLAPLESIIQPNIIQNVMTLVRDMSPRAFCPLKEEINERAMEVQWPLCYLNAGGIRVLITGDDMEKHVNVDDTIIITVGKINVNPQPDNPICRRPVNAVSSDGVCSHNGGFDGRQYEIIFKTLSVQTSKFKDIALSEAISAEKKGAGSDNPALKWSQKNQVPQMEAILHTIKLSWVFAPALYLNGLLTYGSAVELNLLSDCKLDISINQLVLLKHLITEFRVAARDPSSDEFPIGGFVCPYATFFNPVVEVTSSNTSILVAPTPGSDTNQQNNSLLNMASQTRPVEPIRTMSDSGVATFTSFTRTRLSDDGTIRKSASVVFADIEDASQFMEVFVTVGLIEMSLYVTEAVKVVEATAASKTKIKPLREKREKNKGESESLTSVVTGRSLTYTEREMKGAHNILDNQVRVRKCTSQLLHFTLFQPNFYYWKKKTQKTFQLFLFNARVEVVMQNKGANSTEVLLDTARGASDPVTEIPPALATFKVVLPSSSANSASALTNVRGVITLDVERPVQVHLSSEKLHRLMHIHRLLRRNLGHPASLMTKPATPFLYKLKNKLLSEGMESITIQTSQISVSGQEGTVGWDSSSFEICTSARPEGVTAKALITALLVSAGSPGDWRHLVLQPLMLGMELEAIWEAWRRAEGGLSAREPTVQISVELDDVTIELRPDLLSSLNRLQAAYKDLLRERPTPKQNVSEPASSTGSIHERPRKSASQPSLKTPERPLTPKLSEADDTDHFYKDDLRSGAFKIVSGGQLPMAYQVMLSGNAVSWRYPHPRAITRIVAFPLPGQDKEIDCVLELYSSLLQRWEAHTYFKLPVGEPREMQLFVPPPDTVFAIMWRICACGDDEQAPPPFEFSLHKFTQASDPLLHDDHREPPTVSSPCEVTAEQLSGVLRVDSYFAPRLLPRTNAVVRFANLYVHVHNALPVLSSYSTYLAEGYYVSKPMTRTHRVLTVCARNTAAYALVGSHAGTLVVADTNLSCDLLDCATGTMEVIIEEFRMQSGMSVRDSLLTSRTRVMTSGIHMAMQVLRLKTLQALANDWTKAYDKHLSQSTTEDEIVDESEKSSKRKHEVMDMTTEALEGRVALWIHNSCSCAMRVGQDGTDEATPLSPGARLAYRWRSPTAPKKLRFALAGPAASFKWSSSLRFSAGTSRLKIECLDTENSKQFFVGSYVNVKVEESQAIKCMHLSGRLVLANMLRNTLLYKLRSHDLDSPQWYTVNSGEMPAEAISRSVVCGSECDMVLKIKFKSQNTCWSGDIPLKECPKENVPWLVKVPTTNDSQFVSVWCRVVRGRNDGRILATIWPLYVLHSHLPLDTEVLITTDSLTSNEDLKNATPQVQATTQTTPGRGASTHLLAPGTTSARHSLSFQYKDADCIVTREAVPMHYGVTDTSVFDKRTPVLNIDDVIKDIKKWLERTAHGCDRKWPYSVVYNHFDGVWQPASLQPRCDVTVRYQAVRAGGGCSLEVLLCPMVLLCNASPVSLTLRSYDAAPLCKLQSGTALSPPTAIIQKPFFISVEIGRETFVSGQLQVSTEEPGRYGTPPPGQVAIDHPTNFSILCNQKVALLTLYYEIKENIHVLGVSSSYELINRLNTDVLVSAISITNDASEDRTTLHPQTFKTIPPTKDGSSVHGTPLHRFLLRQRWRGGNPAELRNYLCVSLPESTVPLQAAVPIRLGQPPLRRAVSLIDAKAVSIPVVVTQIKHDNRWLVVLAPDPCPQFLVQNHTNYVLTIAQPKHSPDEPSSSRTEAVTECSGVKWWCSVAPKTAVHYSTPAYCARYPPEALPPHSTASPVLTVCKGKEESEMEWCAPVVAADGEQLLQYYGGLTIKLRVHTHPHSTLLELQDVDHNDISASDIRRRLLGAFETDESTRTRKVTAPRSLERTDNITDLHDSTLLNILDPCQEVSTSTRKMSTETAKRRGSCGADFHCGSTMFKEATSTPFLSQACFRGIDEDPDFEVLGEPWSDTERFRCVIAAIGVELSASSDVMPLLELHLDRTTVLVQTDWKKIKTTLSVMDAQIDNLQYETGQYDFAVVATTRATALQPDQWPPLWNMFALTETFATRSSSATLMLKLTHDKWEVVNNKYKELTEVEIRVGTLALYIEDAYVKALADMSRLLVPASGSQDFSLGEERTMQQPLRLRLLHVHPLDLTLTLHTAVRMYIALDQSPLRLSAFKLHDMMTSAERLTHALTVHYLSAAILGAGWVVGGLELLGAPGALAARVGGATGGVRGVASAAAAALLRSLSAWAGSLARNLDLLAGDEEHARRAAAARRRPPPSFVAGLVAGITNFAINILGAVGGLAHHPLVGVAVGETESGAAGLRRGLLGALTKPLSATADLVAYAGSGLLRQTGWDPVPEPRHSWSSIEARKSAGWHRDCVRWMFRLCELTALSGFEVLVDDAPLQLLLTHKFLVIAEHDTEHIVEMIDYRFCSLEPYQGQIIVLIVSQKKQSKAPETKVDTDEDENQVNAAAMARVARYTGAEGGPTEEARVLSLLPPPGCSYALYAALAAALHYNTDTHFCLL